MTTDQKEITWRAPEFEYFHKEVSWYWLVLIIAAVITTFSLWQGNILFALFTVIAVFLILSWGHKHPREIEFRIDEHGLEIEGHKSYSYQAFQGFAVQHLNPEWSEIIFRSRNKLTPYLKILIDNNISTEAKTLLNNFLPEIEYEISLVDHIAKILKF